MTLCTTYGTSAMTIKRETAFLSNTSEHVFSALNSEIRDAVRDQMTVQHCYSVSTDIECGV